MTLQQHISSPLAPREQAYGKDPLKDRTTDLYRGEYIKSFVEKWDELIDWDARARAEGQFFIDVLRARGKETVLDVACGTGFHSVRLLEAGFNVTSADGSGQMIAKAFQNAQARGLILKSVKADWRWLNRDIHGKYDAIICLGNSFTHLHKEADRRRALAEFYAALKHDGILIIDQRNYDVMLDEGFRSKHKYYYCGDTVSAEPEHIDEGLVRFRYDFADGASYTLNLFPLRKAYLRRLLSEAGFERVRTYGDFVEHYEDSDPDFFIHVAEKSAVPLVRWTSRDGAVTGGADVRDVTESYYDSDDADAFYSRIWGGEDLHVGIYEGTRDIAAASAATVDRMLEMLPPLDGTSRVIDLGAGYGGSARRIAARTGATVTCLNISETQNDTNRWKNRRARVADRINVVHGIFEDIPTGDAAFDVAWSQDAFLHSDARDRVLAEAFRVLKPGGHLVFTDPLEADDVPAGALQAVYDRLALDSLGSARRYREMAAAVGFEAVAEIDLTPHLRTHYDRVREELEASRDALAEVASADYLDRMALGLARWVEAADAGHLAWQVFLLRKPG